MSISCFKVPCFKRPFAVAISLFLFLFSNENYGQANLVSNPGFELYYSCPESDQEFVTPPGYAGHTSFRSVIGWYNVNDQTPEYYNACDNGNVRCEHIKLDPFVPDTTNIYSYGVPVNNVGISFVDSGNAYAGLLLYYRFFGSHPDQPIYDMVLSRRREFMATELSSTMSAGLRYYVGFDYQMKSTIKGCGTRIDYPIAIDKLGILFTDTFLYYGAAFDSPEFPAVQPQLEHPSGSLIWDTAGWVQKSWVYTASGEERIMTIGNFYSSEDVHHSGFDLDGHYRAMFLFDNFCVRELDSEPDFTADLKYIGLCPYDTLFAADSGQWRMWTQGSGRSWLSYDQIPFEGDSARLGVRSISNCKLYADSYIVYRMPAADVRDIDTVLCALSGELIDLADVFPDLQFYDSTGKKLQFAPFLDNSLLERYQFQFKYRDSCSEHFGQLHITVLPSPRMDLYDTLRRCIGDSALLVLTDSIGEIQWSTGASTQGIWVDHSGLYWVDVFNECGHTSDSSFVIFERCENCLLIPNAFSPNGDGLNDVFGVKTRCYEIYQFRIEIYNRWGQRVYVSYSLDDAWDGRNLDGSAADQGVYFYQMQYRGNISAEVYRQRGEVHLLR